jgi:hypothetical protein
MKSIFNATTRQVIIGENDSGAAIGLLYLTRYHNTDNFYYRYSDGALGQWISFSNFYQNLDNQ